MLNNIFTAKFAAAVSLSALSTLAQALPVSHFAGWTQIADDEGVYDGGFVDPGWGGQNFDAEYLFYRVDGNTLEIGLQTGFDLEDNKVRDGDIGSTRRRNYFGGDLALSFDGLGNGYEYAIDFGLFTRDYHGRDRVEADNNGDGIDEAGLYRVTEWNNDIYFDQSVPFAMDGGFKIADLDSNTVDFEGESYFRSVSFDLSVLGLDTYDLNAHWTMSCGNDVVAGGDSFTTTTSVPEPGTLPLITLGLLSIFFMRRRQKTQP